MKKIYLLIFIVLNIVLTLKAQNVGVNQPTPTHSLHVSPVNSGDDPIRIDGINAYTVGDTSLLIIDNATGVVRYITLTDLVGVLGANGSFGTDDQNLDSLTLTNLILNAYIEDGSSANVDLSAIKDSAILFLVNNSDTLFSNSTFITGLRDSIDTDVDSLNLMGTILNLYENGGDVQVDLSSLSDNDADPTNELNSSFTLTGSALAITDNGGTITVDLSPVINQAVSSAVPAGTVIAYSGGAIPTGYLLADGSAVSRTTYSDLFATIGTMYGNGDGSTTFNLPNYSGQFLRGTDNGQGVDLDATSRQDRGDGVTGDAVGTKQQEAISSHVHTVNPPATNTNSAGNHAHTVNPPATATNAAGNHQHSVNPPATNTNTTGNHTHSVDPPNTGTSTAGNHTHTIPGYHLTMPGSQIPWYNWGNSSYANNTNTTSASGNHNHSVNIPAFQSASGGNHNHSVDIPSFNSSTAGSHSHSVDIAPFNSGTTGAHTHSVDISTFNSGNTGGNETRPTNISVQWLIKF